MTENRGGAGFDPFLLGDFFDARTCAALIAEMRAAHAAPATVYGQGADASIQARMRKVERITPRPETILYVRQRLLECRGRIEKHFGMQLGDCEEPQFLRYRVGDFFVAHQDGNTGLLRFDHERVRRVSVIIFLDRQSEVPEPGAYCGGSLVFSGRGIEEDGAELAPTRLIGTLAAFRSETTHEVTPVTHGERHSIVSWYG
jgi:SM-20-related protein